MTSTQQAQAPGAAPGAAAAAPPSAAPAQLAKAALRRLAVDKAEPTPENYARAYRLEAGDADAAAAALPDAALRLVERLAARAVDADAAAALAAHARDGRWAQAERDLAAAPAADGAQLATLIERTVKGLERGGRHWTAARKKESLQRVLANSRSDARRLQQRLTQLVTGWEDDVADGPAGEIGDDGRATASEPASVADTPAAAGAAPVGEPASADAVPTGGAGGVGAAAEAPPPFAPAAATPAAPLAHPAWDRVVASFGGTVDRALPQPSPHGEPHALAVALAGVASRLTAEGATEPLAADLEQLCRGAGRVIEQRHRLVDQLGDLCRELTASLTDLAENDSWAQGQCAAMTSRIEDGLTSRSVRSVGDLLRTTRERQSRLKTEREQARDALKGLIHRMLSELDQLGAQTGGFHESVGRYAEVIGRADSLESLAGTVREMVEESRSVQSLVQATQERLADEHAKASDLTRRVGELEAEMKRLSDEVSTDPLTQVANRRGLMQRFDAERGRVERGGLELAVGLLDIDNFKRLNDELGHGVGDEALKALAERVAGTLRPSDHVARYGGEEFVVLLPDTPAVEAQAILTRLQRSLTGGLFMHQDRQLFVTFSAGVTAYRAAERIEEALERADQALYEAKRTGKNRTCIG